MLIFLLVHGSLQRKMKTEEAIKPISLYPFLLKELYMWGCKKTGRLGLGAKNCEAVIRKYMGETNGR